MASNTHRGTGRSNGMQLPPIFKDCVARESTRFSMDAPFVKSGYVYATDGRICVRMKTTEPDSPASSGEHFPDPGTLNWSVAGIETPLPNIPDKPLWGFTECDECDGGWVSKKAYIEVGTTLLSSPLLRILIRHGAKLIVPGPDKACFFSVGEVEGMVMPIAQSARESDPDLIWSPEKYTETVAIQREP